MTELVLNPDGAISDDGTDVTYYQASTRSGFVARGLAAVALVKVWSLLEGGRPATVETLAEHVGGDHAPELVDGFVSRGLLVSVDTTSRIGSERRLETVIVGAATLAKRLAEDLRGIVAPEHGLTVMDDVDPDTVESVDVLVGIEALNGVPRLESWNRMAAAAGTVFVPAVVSPADTIVGPVVLPGGSACFSCFWTRLTLEDEPGAMAHFGRLTTQGLRTAISTEVPRAPAWRPASLLPS